MTLISEYLAAASSPDASADALAIINVGKFQVGVWVRHWTHNLLLIYFFSKREHKLKLIA